jgi:hypothetical protein
MIHAAALTEGALLYRLSEDSADVLSQRAPEAHAGPKAELR